MSADPFDAERAETLLDRAADDPAAVDPAAIDRALSSPDPRARRLGLETVATAAAHLDGEFPAIGDLLTDDDPQVRTKALALLTDLLSDHYEQFQHLVPRLIDRLDDEFEPAVDDALAALTVVAREDPERVLPAVDRVIELLDSERRFIRKGAVEFLAPVASEYPDEVTPALSRLVELVDDPPADLDANAEWMANVQHRRRIQDLSQQAQHRKQVVRETAALTVAEIAAANPNAVRSVADRLRGSLRDDDPRIRGAVIDVFAALGETDPGAVVAVQPELVAEFEEDRAAFARGKAAWALGIAAEARPIDVTEAVTPVIESVIDLLDHDSPQVRGAAVGLLSYVAEHRPEAVEPATDDLIALLDDPHGFVRGNAAWAIGYLDDDRAADVLRDLSDDPAPEVRQAAEAALDRIGGAATGP